MKLPIFLVLILQLQALWVDSSPTTTTPGFMLPLTRKGLEYINDVAQTALDNELKMLEIRDSIGHDVHMDWIVDIYGRGVTIPSSAMAFSPSNNDISWTMRNLGVILYSDWRAEYKKGWFHMSTSGSVDLEVKIDSLQATLHMAQTDSRPSVSLAKLCDASVGDVEAKFHGGSRILVNLFRGVIGGESKKLMQGQMCKIIERAVNVRVNAKLSQLKGNSEIDHLYLLDYNHPHS